MWSLKLMDYSNIFIITVCPLVLNSFWVPSEWEHWQLTILSRKETESNFCEEVWARRIVLLNHNYVISGKRVT